MVEVDFNRKNCSGLCTELPIKPPSLLSFKKFLFFFNFFSNDADSINRGFEHDISELKSNKIIIYQPALPLILQINHLWKIEKFNTDYVTFFYVSRRAFCFVKSDPKLSPTSKFIQNHIVRLFCIV